MDKKILVVEQSEKDCERFGKWLGREDCVTIPCPSSAALENALRNGVRQFTAAIVCWEFFDGTTGAALLTRLKGLRPELPIIISSAHITRELIKNARARGADNCISKSLNEDDFRASLRPFFHSDPDVEKTVERMKERLNLIGNSHAWMGTLREVARVVQRPDDCVLISGETGTGKELIARAIHDFTEKRRQHKCVPVNLTERAKEMLESELFGHERGAFTGADKQHIGWLEEVETGTLFLDEIGELPLELQAKLLRVIQEKEFRRVGGPVIPFRGRFVFATNRNLTQAATEGRFREDLLYRIAQVRIVLPPLRERREDIVLLLNHFLCKYQNSRFHDNSHQTEKRFDPDVYREIGQMPLRGNVRDIQRIVLEGLAKSRGEIISLFHLPEDLLTDAAQPPSALPPQRILDELGRELPQNWGELKYEDAERIFNRVYLKLLLDRHPNKSEAATSAGFTRKTLYNLLGKYGLPGATNGEDQNE